LLCPPDDIVRRRVLLIVPAVILGGVAIAWRLTEPSAVSAALVTIVEFNDAGVQQGAVRRLQVVRSGSDWRNQLTSQQFWSTRRGTTDTPFTGTFYQSHAAGIYRCLCCGNALFSSRSKFDSGTGWPAFSAPMALENIYTRADSSFAMQRTEVMCKLCDAHLGHVFDDGPPPSNLRYCINESALRFAAA
jgi:peptide-methionine (R)-S-oxide reductase